MIIGLYRRHCDFYWLHSRRDDAWNTVDCFSPRQDRRYSMTSTVHNQYIRKPDVSMRVQKKVHSVIDLCVFV